jgi:hypothetical protein
LLPRGCGSMGWPTPDRLNTIDYVLGHNRVETVLGPGSNFEFAAGAEVTALT